VNGISYIKKCNIVHYFPRWVMQLHVDFWSQNLLAVFTLPLMTPSEYCNFRTLIAGRYQSQGIMSSNLLGSFINWELYWFHMRLRGMWQEREDCHNGGRWRRAEFCSLCRSVLDRMREWRGDLGSEKGKKLRECMTFLVHLGKISSQRVSM